MVRGALDGKDAGRALAAAGVAVAVEGVFESVWLGRRWSL